MGNNDKTEESSNNDKTDRVVFAKLFGFANCGDDDPEELETVRVNGNPVVLNDVVCKCENEGLEADLIGVVGEFLGRVTCDGQVFWQ